ncbi:uncharacterized protein BJ171DRAFT_90531 [Polychytrium aggregatum]|uniref:uncharacterized protein n=1 Tax=Polychytrium aggregatum TaxID=110093 RepID=UPI0022FE2D82|nr:uncharacterized protein BJ171DRAFT_90531 [Polychytrium aggregatum]KAI9204842.1 hypothetical protein BJ171DRAFT_90531 [Polychytrium aggregatum]
MVAMPPHLEKRSLTPTPTTTITAAPVYARAPSVNIDCLTSTGTPTAVPNYTPTGTPVYVGTPTVINGYTTYIGTQTTAPGGGSSGGVVVTLTGSVPGGPTNGPNGPNGPSGGPNGPNGPSGGPNGPNGPSGGSIGPNGPSGGPNGPNGPSGASGGSVVSGTVPAGPAVSGATNVPGSPSGASGGSVVSATVPGGPVPSGAVSGSVSGGTSITPTPGTVIPGGNVPETPFGPNGPIVPGIPGGGLIYPPNSTNNVAIGVGGGLTLLFLALLLIAGLVKRKPKTAGAARIVDDLETGGYAAEVPVGTNVEEIPYIAPVVLGGGEDTDVAVPVETQPSEAPILPAVATVGSRLSFSEVGAVVEEEKPLPGAPVEDTTLANVPPVASGSGYETPAPAPHTGEKLGILAGVTAAAAATVAAVVTKTRRRKHHDVEEEAVPAAPTEEDKILPEIPSQPIYGTDEIPPEVPAKGPTETTTTEYNSVPVPGADETLDVPVSPVGTESSGKKWSEKVLLGVAGAAAATTTAVSKTIKRIRHPKTKTEESEITFVPTTEEEIVEEVVEEHHVPHPIHEVIPEHTYDHLGTCTGHDHDHDHPHEHTATEVVQVVQDDTIVPVPVPVPGPQTTTQTSKVVTRRRVVRNGVEVEEEIPAAPVDEEQDLPEIPTVEIAEGPAPAPTTTESSWTQRFTNVVTGAVASATTLVTGKSKDQTTTVQPSQSQTIQKSKRIVRRVIRQPDGTEVVVEEELPEGVELPETNGNSTTTTTTRKTNVVAVPTTNESILQKTKRIVRRVIRQPDGTEVVVEEELPEGVELPETNGNSTTTTTTRKTNVVAVPTTNESILQKTKRIVRRVIRQPDGTEVVVEEELPEGAEPPAGSVTTVRRLVNGVEVVEDDESSRQPTTVTNSSLLRKVIRKRIITNPDGTQTVEEEEVPEHEQQSAVASVSNVIKKRIVKKADGSETTTEETISTDGRDILHDDEWKSYVTTQNTPEEEETVTTTTTNTTQKVGTTQVIRKKIVTNADGTQTVTQDVVDADDAKFRDLIRNGANGKAVRKTIVTNPDGTQTITENEVTSEGVGNDVKYNTQVKKLIKRSDGTVVEVVDGAQV